jgi:pilus assembly protein CpaB
MKRRSLLWFVASAILALLAGVMAMVFLRGSGGGAEQPQVEKQPVVVARNPIAANDVVRVDNVTLEERDQIPSGAAVEVGAVVGGTALRDIAQGEVIKVQDLRIYTGTMVSLLPPDQIAVALPADDILSKWGAVMPGDHVDVLFTLDIILEKPMYIDDIRTVEEAQLYAAIERDQSLDNVSVLTLQNLEVLQIIQEPQPEVEGQAQDQPPQIPQRALILQVDPQDAVVLKYLRDSVGSIQLALRAPENDTLFNVQPVNINYLMLRYGIVLPQPLE